MGPLQLALAIALACVALFLLLTLRGAGRTDPRELDAVRRRLRSRARQARRDQSSK